ncbi:helix-turn-helix domain-containing protein [Saccharibacillus sacchari]|uniref:helix-turn-helix domain-containing protein n=1 Tax=Saccharibacillus sacchari TaxID=456493 RepID=UPI0004BCD2BD|nr:helix-turn-helix domain-containing protein [Saccharibacillus sacchari]
MEKEAKEQEVNADKLVFLLVEATSSNQRATWELPLHFLDDYLLFFMAGGEGRITVDGRFKELRTGGLYLRRPGELVGAKAWNLDGRGLYAIRFRALAWDAAAAETGSYIGRAKGSGGELFLPAVNELILRASLSADGLCESIVRSVNHEDGLERLGARIQLQELIRMMLLEAREVREDDYETRLEQVRTYMEKHHARKLSLDELAEVARLSVRHFMRLFKQRYGRSAMDELTVYRIAQAQNLMRAEGRHPIKDIAQHVGFRDETYFRRTFKKISGVPPAAFIRNARQKIAAYHPEAIGVLLALYIVPSAAPISHPWTEYYRRKYATDQVLPLSDDHQQKLEQLRAEAPDCIIVHEGELNAEEKAELLTIAPLSEMRAAVDWRTRLRLIAGELDRAGAAEAWLERYGRKADFVRTQLVERLGNIRLLVLKLAGTRLMLPKRYSVASVFYDDLRLEAPDELVRTEEDFEIEPERLSNWQFDRILMIVQQDEESQQTWHSLNRHNAWKQIEAVRLQRVELFPANLLSEYTAFTHDLILDEVLNIWRDPA